MNDLQWTWRRHNHGGALAADLMDTGLLALQQWVVRLHQCTRVCRFARSPRRSVAGAGP